jgi:alpha-tubulin suppressor-like RCC1 family protein
MLIFSDVKEAFVFIKEHYGAEIFYKRNFPSLLIDFCPKLKTVKQTIRLIYSDRFYEKLKSITDENSLLCFFSEVEKSADPETTELLRKNYSDVFGIVKTPIPEPEEIEIEPENSGVITKKTVIATPKRLDITLSAKFSQTGLITPESKLYTWGGNEVGSCGHPGFDPISRPKFVCGGIKSVSMGHKHSLAVKYDGSLLGFGENRYGGLGFDVPEHNPEPVKILSGVAFADCGGVLHSYAVHFDGRLVSLRSLGTGSLLSDVVTVSAGMLHSVAVKSDGTLWAWGENRFGQLGDGTKTTRQKPVFITGDVIAAWCGHYHTLALKSDKTLWAWGLIPDIDGGLAEVPRLIPAMFMSDVKTAAAGEMHSLALKTDGRLYAWGRNFHGQLGDGSTVNNPFPSAVMTDVIEIAAGERFSVCRKKDGSVFAWGKNEKCEVGDGNDQDCFRPIEIDIPKTSFMQSIAERNNMNNK